MKKMVVIGYILIKITIFVLVASLMDNNADASSIKFASKNQQSNWKDEFSEHDYLQHSTGEYSYGSGKYDEYVESLRSSEKDDDFEASAEGSGDSKDTTRDSDSGIDTAHEHNSRCLQMLQQANKDNIPGSFVPRCTFDGHFSPLQCHGGTGECWCSTKDGLQVPGTLNSDPLTSSCDKLEAEGDRADKKGGKKTPKSEGKARKQEQTSDQIVLKTIETKGKGDKELFVPYDNIGKKKKIVKESNKRMNDSLVGHEEHLFLSSFRLHSLLSQPFLLAAMVSLLLVCVVCVLSVVVLSFRRLRRRSHKAGTKAQSECESVINGYTSPHLTYPAPAKYATNGGEIYAGGGFSYTPGISPAKCQTMNLRMSPWAHGNGYLTNKSSHLVYSKCAEQDVFA